MERIIRPMIGMAGLLGCVALLADAAHAKPAATVSPGAMTRVPGQQPAVAPAFFNTVAAQISARRFWTEWERARRDASDMPQMQQLIAPARRLPALQKIAYVQSAVSKGIGWRSDATQYGIHDYWASAAETLSNGRGDMEDRAILKMQALRSLGFPIGDLYLTLGRDSVGGPQTVLIVRAAGRYFVLDDTGAPPYTPDHRPEFKPVLTFGYGASWVHMPTNRVAVAARPARSASGSATGFADGH